MNLRALFGHALMISLVFATTAVAGQHGKDASRLAPGLETSQGLKDNSNPGKRRVHLGPRPFWLVEEMDEGALKNTLQSCHAGKIRPTDFSIGHRGAPLQFPEHTRESYIAAVRMGQVSWNATSRSTPGQPLRKNTLRERQAGVLTFTATAAP